MQIVPHLAGCKFTLNYVSYRSWLLLLPFDGCWRVFNYCESVNGASRLAAVTVFAFRAATEHDANVRAMHLNVVFIVIVVVSLHWEAFNSRSLRSSAEVALVMCANLHSSTHTQCTSCKFAGERTTVVWHR